MKRLVYCLSICVFIITCVVWIDVYTRIKDYEAKTNVRVLQLVQVIEEQEKEIRLLRQDVDIIENGYRPK